MTLHSTPHGYALVFLLFVPNIGSPIQGIYGFGVSVNPGSFLRQKAM